MAVAIVAALSAWQQPEPVFAARMPDRDPVVALQIERPAPLDPVVGVEVEPLDAPTAAATTRFGLVVELQAHPELGPDLTGWRVAVLRGSPWQVIADRPCAPGPTDAAAAAILADLPRAPIRLSAYAPGDSPRHGYRAFLDVDLSAPEPPTRARIEIPHLPVLVGLRFTPCADDPAYGGALWLPITAWVAALDDPGWVRQLPAPVPLPLTAGSLQIDFPPLPRGRYRLHLDGFEIDGNADFSVEDGGRIERDGRPTPPSAGTDLEGAGPERRTTAPGARPGPDPRRGR